jgi:hypothetical protein
MKDKIKIRSVILCDDARQEMNGKEILIGVYNDIIIFSKFPAFLRQLIIRISCDIVDGDAKSISMYVKDPSGTTVFENRLLIPPEIGEHQVIGYIIQGLTFYSEGTYSVEVSIADDPPLRISDFVVRSPQSEEERRRVPAQIA